jgi:glycosyltransferase involved in cell wall biosynthesis
MVFNIQENWLLPRAAAVTVASRALEQIVGSMGVPPEFIFYLPNGVKEIPVGEGAKMRHQLNIPDATPVVLLYTRFFEFNQDKLRFLFTEIFRCVPDVCFLVLGKGRHGEEALLRVAATEEGFSSALVMAGWIEPGLIPDFIAAGDVAIYPFSDTLVNRTKCPAKVTELLHTGIAVVADRVGQLAEYIESGISGELCDPDNWADMAERTVALLRDSPRRQILAENGARRMRERFRWCELAQNLTRFYEKLLVPHVCPAKL